MGLRLSAAMLGMEMYGALASAHAEAFVMTEEQPIIWQQLRQMRQPQRPKRRPSAAGEQSRRHSEGGSMTSIAFLGATVASAACAVGIARRQRRSPRAQNSGGSLSSKATATTLRAFESEIEVQARGGLPKMAIRLLSIDCTDTLLRWSASLGTLYHRGFLRGGSLPDAVPTAAELDAKWPAAFKEVMQQWPIFGHHDSVSSFSWWRAVALRLVEGSRLAEDPDAFERGFAEVYKIFQTTEAYEAYPDTVPFLEWASSTEGLKVCVLSNSTDQYRVDVLPALGLAKYIDFFVLAQEEGVQKPDSRIFQLAAERAGVKMQEMVHVGNSKEKDYLAAIAAGCQGVLLQRREELSSAGQSADATVVESLLELRPWIETRMIE